MSKISILIVFLVGALVLTLHTREVYGILEESNGIVRFESQLVIIEFSNVESAVSMSGIGRDQDIFIEEDSNLIKLMNIDLFIHGNDIDSGSRIVGVGRFVPDCATSWRCLELKEARIDNENRFKRQVTTLGAPLRKLAVIFTTTPAYKPSVSHATFDGYYSSNPSNMRRAVARYTGGLYSMAQPGFGYAKFDVSVARNLNCSDYLAIIGDSVAAAQAKGMVPTDFNQVMVVLGGSRADCGICGLARRLCMAQGDKNPAQCWSLNICGFPGTPLHELGHNFGFRHANVPGVEYGDDSCRMGKAPGCSLVNFAARARVGYIRQNRGIITMSTSGERTITIFDLHNANETLGLGIKVPYGNNTLLDAFWISYRVFNSIDDWELTEINSNKVFVHVIEAEGHTTRLARLAVGETFQDSKTGIRIKFQASSVTNRRASIQIFKP